jgi:hypothetical protein
MPQGSGGGSIGSERSKSPLRLMGQAAWKCIAALFCQPFKKEFEGIIFRLSTGNEYDQT